MDPMQQMMQMLQTMQASQEESQKQMQQQMVALQQKSDTIIRQNEELQENTKALGFFAAHVRALDGSVFQSAFGQLEGPQQQRVLAITDGTPVTPRTNEGYKRTHNGMENGNYSHSTMFASGPNKKSKVKEVPAFTPDQLKNFEAALKTFEAFLPPQVKGVKMLADGTKQAAPVAGQEHDYADRKELIKNLLQHAVTTRDDEFAILIQPYIFSLLVAKYAKSLKQVKSTVDAFLSAKGIPQNDTIDQLFNGAKDDLAKVNSSKTIVLDPAHDARTDYATRIDGFLTSEEAKAFSGVYSVLRNIHLLDSLYAEDVLKKVVKDFAAIEAINVIDKTVKLAKDTVVGAQKMLDDLKAFKEDILQELPNHSALKIDLPAAIERVSTILDRNRAGDVDKLKDAFHKLNKLLTTCYTEKYSIDKFLTSTMERWYTDNQSMLEEVVSQSQTATTSSAPGM